MALTRLNNLISDRTGRKIYVNPDDFNASDLISNNGNSPTKPFKTLQRALLEVSRYSYVAGLSNDRYDQFTIQLEPGDYVIDNRPGLATVSGLPVLTDQSNFDILNVNNDLYKFNSTAGGVVIPRGTSIVGTDLRKTRIRPRYVPDPTVSNIDSTSIFKVTGACYFWQFSIFDALPMMDSSGQGGAYKDSTNVLVDPQYSHHKVTAFVYANQSDLDLYYNKVANGFVDIPDNIGEISSTVQENRIVGPLSDIISIQSINITNGYAVITTTAPHGVFKGQRVTIGGITGNYTTLNTQYNVNSIDNVLTFRVPLASQLPNASVPSNLLTSATVTAEIDTVDSSSPYIFNCSLRSTYGLCGLWADGSQVTGFKSMVVAQFTGVSLQKDDNAFIKFVESAPVTISGQTVITNPTFLGEGQDVNGTTTSLHQSSDGYTFFKKDWRNYHIRISNGAFIQSVSVFAVGYAEQHLIESGGDYSLTNSNSNFGAVALIADGFRSTAYTLDKKGYISHIVPPKTLPITTTIVPYYGIDIQKSKAGASTKLHLYGLNDPLDTPAFNINQYKLGGKVSDKIYAQLVSETGSVVEYSALISPNGVESHGFDPDSNAPIGTQSTLTLDILSDTFTTPEIHNYETGTPIRFYSSNGYLPLGLKPAQLYYAIKLSNTTFKVAPSAQDAIAGAAGIQNSIVNIRSVIPANSKLGVKSFVADSNPDLTSYLVSSFDANTDSISTGTFNHGFATGDRIFFRPDTGVVNYTLPTIDPLTPLNLKYEYFVIYLSPTTFRLAFDQASANSGTYINITGNGTPNSLRVFKNPQKSPLRYDPVVSNWYVNVDPGVTNQIHPVLTSAATIYANPQLATTDNAYLKRTSDDRENPDRTYRLRYVLPKTEKNARPPLPGYVIKRKTDDNNNIIPHDAVTVTVSGNTVTTTTNDFDRVYYIYKIDTIQDYIENQQDGVYYLTVLLGDISPSGIQFSSTTNWFDYLAYSQDSANLYPDLDKDNPNPDPNPALTVADNLIHGFVYQDDNRHSITKESTLKFLSETNYANLNLGAKDGKAVSGREDRLIAFGTTVSGTLLNIPVELRRTSQIRAGNQTFEYTGFSSGNYSAAFPSAQKRTLDDKEILFSQSQKRRGGIVFYSGLNAYGDLYVGNQKINAVTGEVTTLNKPVLKVAGSTAVSNVEYVPYVSGTKNVNIAGNLYTGTDQTATPNSFNNDSFFNFGLRVKVQSPVVQQGGVFGTNRGLIVQDVVYIQKTSPISATIGDGTNGTVKAKQTVLSLDNNVPNPQQEGKLLGDLYYKPNISSTTRNQSWIYTGQPINSGWAQTGLVGTGHLTAIEDSYSGVADPYTVTGRLGINKTNPSTALHVGGDVTIDNDIAVNGGDITTTSSTFNIANTSTTVTIGATTGTITLRNPSVLNSSQTVSLFTTTSGTITIGGAGGSTTLNNNLTVNGANTVLNTNLTVNGTNFTGNVTNFTVNNTLTKFNSTTISIVPNKIFLNDVTSPTNTGALNGGIVLRGTTDKTFTWSTLQNGEGVWTSNQHISLNAGLSYNIDQALVLNTTTLGSTVINSSLQKVGTLNTGVWQASTIALAYGGTGATTQPGAANNILPSQSGAGPINTRFLTTDGSNVSWGTVPVPTIDQVLASGNSTSRTLTVGQLNSTGDIIAFLSSDKRLKDNVKPIENALDKVGKLSGNSFVWNKNSNYNGKTDIGVIAQEVAEFFPEAVAVRDTGYLAVRYEKLIPVLIEAIKELKAEVESLKK